MAGEGCDGTSVNWEGAWLPPGVNVRMKLSRLHFLSWFPSALCAGSVFSLVAHSTLYLFLSLNVYKPQVVDFLRTQLMLLYSSMENRDLGGTWHIVNAHLIRLSGRKYCV